MLMPLQTGLPARTAMEKTMAQAQGNILLRDDTMFGVCEGLGEDFGFNANYLRVALAVLLLASPMAGLGIYAGLGMVVAVSRLIAPNPKRATPEADEQPAAQVAAPAENEVAEPLPLAA
jgi:phage shock protein PspC (stress-responsive transcriptional regulator)